MQYVIKRRLLEDLKNHLPQKEMSLIMGSRQAGKTTLMLQLKDYLEKQGEGTLFLNLDFEQDKPFFASQTALLNRMRLEFGKKKGYIFIDEIQRKENAGIFLKGIYDVKIPLEVKCRELKEDTVGRPLRNFIDAYKPKEAWIVNLTLRKEVRINHTAVKFIPFFDLI